MPGTLCRYQLQRDLKIPPKYGLHSPYFDLSPPNYNICCSNEIMTPSFRDDEVANQFTGGDSWLMISVNSFIA